MPSNKPFMGEYTRKATCHGNELDGLQVSFKMLEMSLKLTHQTLIVSSTTLHSADGYAMESLTFRWHNG